MTHRWWYAGEGLNIPKRFAGIQFRHSPAIHGARADLGGHSIRTTPAIIGLPMTTASYNDSNPFAIRFAGPNGAVSYVLGHQPKSFDWRVRAAKRHPWRQVPPDVFEEACETLTQIVDLHGSA